MQSWFKVTEELRQVCDLFLSVQYRTLFMENRFLSFVQAAEGYHRASPRFNQAVLSEEKHHSRIEEILSTIPEQYNSWLDSKLKYSNEPNLRHRLNDLCKDNQEVIEPLVGSVGGFVDNVVKERNRPAFRFKCSSPLSNHIVPFSRIIFTTEDR
jgi:hypothetical protein